MDCLPGARAQGPGSRGGAGSGSGTGSGEGQGSGLGPGVGGGIGGGAYRPGSGVSMLKLVREVTPNYTAAALRAKVQGIVVVECVVLADGTIGDVKIIQSLDKIFGLDTLTPRSGDQTARVRAIDRMRPWGGTALYDVVLDALNRLGRQPGRRSMVFFTEDVSRLDGFFDEILEDLSNQYLVSYSYPDATRDGQWHRIRVEVDGRYRVRARPKYRLTRD